MSFQNDIKKAGKDKVFRMLALFFYILNFGLIKHFKLYSFLCLAYAEYFRNDASKNLSILGTHWLVWLLRYIMAYIVSQYDL